MPVGRGMTRMDAAADRRQQHGSVALLVLADPRDALCYLLAFPIWMVSRDLGAVAGAAVGAVAFLLFVVCRIGRVDFGPLGYLAVAAVFLGAVAAGVSGSPADRRATARSAHRSCCGCSPRQPKIDAPTGGSEPS